MQVKDGFLNGPEFMTPGELGDILARLVWESFTDFLQEGEGPWIFRELGTPWQEGPPPERAAEEILIFLLWIHTRGLQLAFAGTDAHEDVRGALDALHKAVFEDLVEQGTPEAQLPVFEQRVGVRYNEYSQAAQGSDQEVGQMALLHLAAATDAPEGTRNREDLARALTGRAVALANPLRDFLDDVTIVRPS